MRSMKNILNIPISLLCSSACASSMRMARVRWTRISGRLRVRLIGPNYQVLELTNHVDVYVGFAFEKR